MFTYFREYILPFDLGSPWPWMTLILDDLDLWSCMTLTLDDHGWPWPSMTLTLNDLTLDDLDHVHPLPGGNNWQVLLLISEHVESCSSSTASFGDGSQCIKRNPKTIRVSVPTATNRQKIQLIIVKPGLTVCRQWVGKNVHVQWPTWILGSHLENTFDAPRPQLLGTIKCP